MTDTVTNNPLIVCPGVVGVLVEKLMRVKFIGINNLTIATPLQEFNSKKVDNLLGYLIGSVNVFKHFYFNKTYLTKI